MTVLYNGAVNTTRLSGASVYVNRRVQWDDDVVSAAAAGIAIGDTSGTSIAPVLQKALYDDQFPTDYLRGDIVTLQNLDYEPSITPDNPFHVCRVIKTGWPLACTEVYLARVDMYFQTATLFQRITEYATGVAHTADWDGILQVQKTTADGSYGVGWQATDPLTSVLRSGYFSPRSVTIAVNEYALTYELVETARTPYERLALVYEPPLVLNKGDVVALADGRRVVIEDITQPFQLFGVTIATVAYAEVRKLTPTPDIVYSIV